MEKHKGYQNYLKKTKYSGIKPFFKKISNNNTFLSKMYYRLTNISIKKLGDIPNINQASSILDIGCGTGETLEYLQKFLNPKIKLYGVDLDKNPELNKDVVFNYCDIDNQRLPFEENTFDIAISNFVLEHLKNPQNLFLESLRVLKPGGFFYCSTDYYFSIFCPDYWNFYSDPTHVRPWTKRSLITLGEMSGFEVYKIGVIRWWEFLPLLPFVPLLNILTKSNFSFIPFEIVGRTVFFIGKKN